MRGFGVRVEGKFKKRGRMFFLVSMRVRMGVGVIYYLGWVLNEKVKILLVNVT